MATFTIDSQTIDVRVTDADWRAGTACVEIGDNYRRATLGEITDAAAQGGDLGRAYQAVERDMRRQIEAARIASVMACTGHRAETTCDTGFVGPIYGAVENRAAHGNICQTETCRCGAVRRSNINGWHVERGGWR